MIGLIIKPKLLIPFILEVFILRIWINIHQIQLFVYNKTSVIKSFA